MPPVLCIGMSTRSWCRPVAGKQLSKGSWVGVTVGGCARRGDGVECVSMQQAKVKGVLHDLCNGGFVLAVGEQVLDDGRHGACRQPVPDFPTAEARAYAYLDVA